MEEYILNTEKETYVNEFKTSYPSCLVKYIEAFGIIKEDNCFCGSIYYYQNNRLCVEVDGNYIYLTPYEGNIQTAYASIAKNGSFLGLKNRFWNLSIVWDSNGILYFTGDRNVNYRIKVQKDSLGNVVISLLNFEKELGCVVIRVGEEHDTPQSYIDQLREKTDYSTCDVIEKIIDVMFEDPRVLGILGKTMSKMPSSVDKAYSQKAIELWNERCAKLNGFLASLDSDYSAKLRQLKECAQAFEQTSKGGK